MGNESITPTSEQLFEAKKQALEKRQRLYERLFYINGAAIIVFGVAVMIAAAPLYFAVPALVPVSAFVASWKYPILAAMIATFVANMALPSKIRSLGKEIVSLEFEKLQQSAQKLQPKSA
jgi:pilus assembly protein TadC